MSVNDRNARTMERMKHVRREMVKEYPFFGELIMNLKLAAAAVGTAGTDGSYLFLDPNFERKLSDEELTFIFMHEVMHVVFLHCYRRGGRDRELWNLACDYVVNSNILMAMGLEEYEVVGKPVIHKVCRNEAYNYSAETVYEMLLNQYKKQLDSNKKRDEILDAHDIWLDVEVEYSQENIERWNEIVMEATGKWYGTYAGVAAGCLKRYKMDAYKTQLKWKQIVRDFIRHRHNDEDYGFHPPERRFQDEEFIYPGINPEESEVIENLWFFIDKSGSISKKMLMEIIQEIETGIRQVKNMQGLVSFFDVAVTPPFFFKDLREFLRIGVPLPDGGTCFQGIFQYISKQGRQYDPQGIIILTDGYAKFPEKNPLHKIPVLWIILDNPSAKPKFGRCIHIDTQLQKAGQ